MRLRRMPQPSNRSGCCPGKGPLRRAFVVVRGRPVAIKTGMRALRCASMAQPTPHGLGTLQVGPCLPAPPDPAQAHRVRQDAGVESRLLEERAHAQPARGIHCMRFPARNPCRAASSRCVLRQKTNESASVPSKSQMISAGSARRRAGRHRLTKIARVPARTHSHMCAQAMARLRFFEVRHDRRIALRALFDDLALHCGQVRVQLFGGGEHVA